MAHLDALQPSRRPGQAVPRCCGPGFRAETRSRRRKRIDPVDRGREGRRGCNAGARQGFVNRNVIARHALDREAFLENGPDPGAVEAVDARDSLHGVPDIVHDDDNGILIEPGRVDQLRVAILALRADPIRRRVLGERGREFAKGFTADVMSSKYRAIYASVLGREL
jgi:hypothetical protein